MRVLAKAASISELPPSTLISRASVVAKPRNQGLVPRRTSVQKIPLFFNAVSLE
jgi:hypothetical protein